MIHYRATRPQIYGGQTPGHTEVAARQGHYIHAESLADAFRIMDKRFPNDRCFDFQIWDGTNNVGRGRVTRVTLTEELLTENERLSKSRII